MSSFWENLLCLSKRESFCLEMFPKKEAAKTKKPRNRKPPQKQLMNQFDFDESEEEILFVSFTEEEINSVDYHSNKILAIMKIGGREVKMLIDSGASCNVLPIKYLPKGTVVEKSNHTLKMYSKSTMSAIGKAKNLPS